LRAVGDIACTHGLYCNPTSHFLQSGLSLLPPRLLDLDPLVIEANLAHAVKDANGRSYNRTQYLTQRFAMIQQWADYLDKLRVGADVIPLHKAA
jgi:hypothetical protein